MIVYCITNMTNGKKYVGQTVQPLCKRWHRHKLESKRVGTTKRTPQAIHLAMSKYGIENFKIDVLDTLEGGSRDFLNQRESDFIKSLNTLSPNGYNLRLEDHRRDMLPETKHKMSNAQKGNLNQARLRPVVYLKDPDGCIWGIKSLNAFEQRYGFATRKFSDILRGRRTFVNGWSKPSEEELRNAIYVYYFSPFISVVHNVTLKKNFRPSQSREAVVKRAHSLRKTWSCSSMDEKKKIASIRSTLLKQGDFHFIHISGKSVQGKNLSQFCRENALSQSHMWSVIKKKRNSHRGWWHIDNKELIENPERLAEYLHNRRSEAVKGRVPWNKGICILDTNNGYGTLKNPNLHVSIDLEVT